MSPRPDSEPEAPRFSVVVPLYDEADVLHELVRRIVSSCAALPGGFELVLVDDASRDATPALLDRLAAADPRLRVVHRTRNGGQFRATCSGLAVARGAWVLTLDGDLQDPPEVLAALAAATDAPEPPDVVFAVKSGRDEPAWFIAGQALYHRLQDALAGASMPPGAGSFALMSARLAHEVAALPLDHANLSAALTALGAGRVLAVPYHKRARRDGHSRVGPVGLVREALGSLALTGALERGLWLCAGGAAVTSVALWWVPVPVAGRRLAALAWLGGGAGLAASAWVVARRRRRILRAARLGARDPARGGGPITSTS